MPKILVVGSLNMDLVVCAPKVPTLGETILGKGFMTCPGGKGANQAVAAARLGGDVAMLGCIGDDLFGKDLLANLIKNRVNAEQVSIMKGCSTGIAMIVIKDGDNLIIVDPGANSRLSPQIINSLEEWISRSSMVLLQLEIPLETVEQVLEIAKKNQSKVLLNPAPARKLPEELLKMIDIITPNESECELITGIKPETIEDAKEAVFLLMERGIEQVVITLGGNGVIYNSGQKFIHKKALKVNVVDTTAAGDSFTGALAVALSEGIDINEAVDFANIVGSITVTKKGAQSSLPSLDEVKAVQKLGIPS